MVKSVASTVVLVGMVVVVTSAVAVALRLYGLAVRVPRAGRAVLSSVTG
jgi:hypothetical protein